MALRDYLFVCVDAKEFFAVETVPDPTALYLLAHHNDSPGHGEPNGEHHVCGRWAGKRVAITSPNHKGKEFTGNYKLGNLYAVARAKFNDISLDILDGIEHFKKSISTLAELEVDQYEAQESPAVECIDVVDEELSKSCIDGVRFVARHIKGQRITVTQEQGDDGAWRDAFDE